MSFWFRFWDIQRPIIDYGFSLKSRLAVIQNYWKWHHSPCSTSHQSATVSITQSCIIFEIFDVEEYRDLEIMGSLTPQIYARSAHRSNLQAWGYLFAADSIGLSSTSEPQKKLYRVRLCVMVVQGYSRSSKFVLIESQYATSY